MATRKLLKLDLSQYLPQALRRTGLIIGVDFPSIGRTNYAFSKKSRPTRAVQSTNSAVGQHGDQVRGQDLASANVYLKIYDVQIEFGFIEVFKRVDTTTKVDVHCLNVGVRLE